MFCINKLRPVVFLGLMLVTPLSSTCLVLLHIFLAPV